MVMIIGDPYRFAIIMKTIKEWNIDETFCNGVLLFCVDGNIYPKEICNATLNSEINPLKERLENIGIDNKIFNMNKEEAFQQIYDRTFPEDWDLDNDYQFDITPLSFSDNDCYIFAVSNGIQVRILAAELEYIKESSRHMFENANIKEVFISAQEIREIAKALKVD